MENDNGLRDLLEGITDPETQNKVRTAYWLGVSEGLAFSKDPKRQISHKDGDVIYLAKRR